jgi:AcrR family transcriptional regulator
VTVQAIWKTRVIERSVERAAASSGDRRSYNSIAERALRPTRRIVEAATELAQETNGKPFTVQDVLDRANVSLQTFYRHFGSKDDLLLAVIEESVTTSAEAYRAKALKLSDPVARVESVVKAPFARDGTRLSATITREHLRLLESHAREVRSADDPYRRLLAEMIAAAQDAGRFPGVDANEEADMIMGLVLARYHSLVLGVARHSFAREAVHIWSFCVGALSRGEAGLAQRARPS